MCLAYVRAFPRPVLGTQELVLSLLVIDAVGHLERVFFVIIVCDLESHGTYVQLTLGSCCMVFLYATFRQG